MVSEAIAARRRQAINYFVAQKYIEALKDFATLAEPEGFLHARGSDEPPGVARWYRRAGQGCWGRRPAPNLDPGQRRGTYNDRLCAKPDLVALVGRRGCARGAGNFHAWCVAIWFAASASSLARCPLVVPMPWQLQLVLFGALGLVALLLCRRLRSNEDQASDQPSLNQRGMQYVGQGFALVEAMRDGTGKVRLGDTVWLVQGKDAPAGTTVRVTGVRGAILTVERA